MSILERDTRDVRIARILTSSLQTTTGSKNHAAMSRKATASSSSTLLMPDKVGPLLFCPSCGSLLDVPNDEDVIKCRPCGADLDAAGEQGPKTMPFR